MPHKMELAAPAAEIGGRGHGPGVVREEAIVVVGREVGGRAVRVAPLVAGDGQIALACEGGHEGRVHQAPLGKAVQEQDAFWRRSVVVGGGAGGPGNAALEGESVRGDVPA